MEVKIGDIVHVTGKVSDLSGAGQGVKIDFGPYIAWVHPDAIVHIEPQPLKVGEVVRSSHGASGELLAVDGDFAWVRFAQGPSTISITALERA